MLLSLFSSTEPLGSQGKLIVYRCSVVVVVVLVAFVIVHNVQTSFPLKPLGQSKQNFMWSILMKGECPYMVIALKSSLISMKLGM